MMYLLCGLILRQITKLELFACIILLIVFPFLGNSQSIPSQINKTIAEIGLNSWDLKKYLWSFSKCESRNGHKPKLNFEVIENWGGLGAYLSVSDDGKYFAYSIAKGHHHSDIFLKNDSLVVQSTNDEAMRWVFAKAKPVFFTADNKQFIFQSNENNLCFLQLKGKEYLQTKVVTSYKVHSRHEWLAWQLKGNDSEVVLHNLASGEEKKFTSVVAYQFDKSGDWLVCEMHPQKYASGTKELALVELATGIQYRFANVESYMLASSGKAILLHKNNKINGVNTTSLEYLNLRQNLNAKIIWLTTNEKVGVGNLGIDDSGNQVIFSILDSSHINNGISIWYYQRGMDSATVKVFHETKGIPNHFSIQTPIFFSENSQYILFSLQKQNTEVPKAIPELVQMEVWSYKNRYLSATNIEQNKKTIKAVISTKGQTVLPLETAEKKIYRLHGDFAIVKKSGKEIYGDRFWEDGYYDDSVWLMSLADGKNQLLPTKCKWGSNTLWFSPEGKYVVYFDSRRGCQYFSFDLRTKKEHVIAGNVPLGELGYVSSDMYNEKPEFPIGIAAWLQKDDAVLVYGQRDIWLLDLSGKNAAINVTNGYGLAHNIIFSLLGGERLTLNHDKIPVLGKKDIILLQSFNPSNKYAGFYRITIGDRSNPMLLHSGPYFYNLIRGCHNLNLSNNGQIPLKAKDVNVWIVQRQTATEAPNYYKTSDFRSFSRLTNFQPHSVYHWLTQELHTYKHLDGKCGQGILFKPEDFDSSKKYPVLIVFYQTFSPNLYQFLVPSLNRTAVTPGESPAWFLSNGYLVFTPDIYVAPLAYGPTAFNVIEGVVRHLKQLPFVDSNKLGCASHSWSAKLGAYVFTHSQSIAATAISEGMVYGNMINTALSTGRTGMSNLEIIEKSFHFGELWENKNSWLDQTTVLHVDKASSPLLLFCNKGSSEDYQNQTLQLFTALRRLEKSVWWLRYDKGEHILHDLDEMKDFTIRYMQYFDHYLKNAPAPKWMTQGMSVQINDVAAGYNLDPAGSCSISSKSVCTICQKWNEKYEKDPGMFERPISEWELNY